MAQFEIALNEVRDRALAVRLEHEIGDAATGASEPDEGMLGFTILDEGHHVDIQMELLGQVERRAVSCHPGPGEVRRVVERFLSDVGLR
jgi:hypothetical protein